MDITPTTTTNIPTSATTTTKSPEHDTETPTRITTTTTPTVTKSLSFSNGVLKRHSQPHLHHHPMATNHPVTVTYKECLKNHAANLGGHALDGCGEFMPSPTASATDPSSIKCAACGCHRNFHRREPDETPIPTTTHVIEYQPHHRHHPPPPPPFQTSNRSPNSASPPPISSSYYPSSAPHMLLALSTGLAAPPESTAAPSMHMGSTTRKRFRTKFTQEQKEKMLKFAERVGWKMQKRDDDLVQEFCTEVGVDRGVLKVWMHNNKNTFSKRDSNNNANGASNSKSFPEMLQDANNNNNDAEDLTHRYPNDVGASVGANGSSSSS